MSSKEMRVAGLIFQLLVHFSLRLLKLGLGHRKALKLATSVCKLFILLTEKLILFSKLLVLFLSHRGCLSHVLLRVWHQRSPRSKCCVEHGPGVTTVPQAMPCHAREVPASIMEHFCAVCSGTCVHENKCILSLHKCWPLTSEI